MINISIIIPSYNSEKTIELCLKSVLTQKTSVSYETIVIDSSPNNKVDNIVKKHPKIKFIKLKEKTFPGIARNIGAKKAKGNVIVFIDSDVILQSDALEKIWLSYKKGYKLFGGALELAKFKWNSLIEHYFFRHQFQKRRSLEKRRNLSSALMISEKELFHKEGWFKDTPRAEDTELTERLCKKGIDIFFIPSIVGLQIYNRNFRELLKKVFITGNNLYYIRYKNRLTPSKNILLTFFLPTLTFAKISRINLRNMAYNGFKGNILGFLMSPLMYFCGIFWMLGMYKGIFKNLF